MKIINNNYSCNAITGNGIRYYQPYKYRLDGLINFYNVDLFKNICYSQSGNKKQTEKNRCHRKYHMIIGIICVKIIIATVITAIFRNGNLFTPVYKGGII